MAKPQEKPKADFDNMPFEQALKELETIVRRLESGSGELETSINDYIHGTELKEFCLSKLREARLRVEHIVQAQNNGQETTSNQATLALQPFDTKTS